MNKQSIADYLEQQGEGLTALFYYTLQKAQDKPKRAELLKSAGKELFKAYCQKERMFIVCLDEMEVERFIESIKEALRSMSSQPWYSPRKIAGELSLVFILLYLGFERIIVTIHNEEQVVMAVLLAGLYLMLEELEHNYKGEM